MSSAVGWGFLKWLTGKRAQWVRAPTRRACEQQLRLSKVMWVWAAVKVWKALRLSSRVLFSQGNHMASSADKMDNLLCSKQLHLPTTGLQHIYLILSSVTQCNALIYMCGKHSGATTTSHWPSMCVVRTTNAHPTLPCSRGKIYVFEFVTCYGNSHAMRNTWTAVALNILGKGMLD